MKGDFGNVFAFSRDKIWTLTFLILKLHLYSYCLSKKPLKVDLKQNKMGGERIYTWTFLILWTWVYFYLYFTSYLFLNIIKLLQNSSTNFISLWCWFKKGKEKNVSPHLPFLKGKDFSLGFFILNMSMKKQPNYNIILGIKERLVYDFRKHFQGHNII